MILNEGDIVSIKGGLDTYRIEGFNGDNLRLSIASIEGRSPPAIEIDYRYVSLVKKAPIRSQPPSVTASECVLRQRLSGLVDPSRTAAFDELEKVIYHAEKRGMTLVIEMLEERLKGDLWPI